MTSAQYPSCTAVSRSSPSSSHWLTRERSASRDKIMVHIHQMPTTLVQTTIPLNLSIFFLVISIVDSCFLEPIRIDIEVPDILLTASINLVHPEILGRNCCIVIICKERSGRKEKVIFPLLARHLIHVKPYGSHC
jgi:hypothetical protein